MNIYSVYTDSSKKKRNPILIKQGFSFVAAIFNFFWAIYYKMWFIAGSTAILTLLLGNIKSMYLAYSINIAILFLFGFFASEMREYYATRNGFELSDVLLAQSEEEAEVRYYMRENNQKGITDV